MWYPRQVRQGSSPAGASAPVTPTKAGELNRTSEVNPGAREPLAGDRPQRTKPLKVITPAEAAEWVDKECKVQFTVKSSFDGFDWAFVLNSEKDHADPKNFQVLIEKETAVPQYKSKGIRNLDEYFKKGTLIFVTGRIQKYVNKRTGSESYEIRVRNADQIELP